MNFDEVPSNFLESTAILRILGVGLVGVDGGIFHRITMTSMTGAWYKNISNFEAILVGLVILEIFVLRYLLILPVDFTKWIEKGVLLQSVLKTRKRKKRDVKEMTGVKESCRLLETMLKVLQHLDEEECLLKALCELEDLQKSQTIPLQIGRILTVLKHLDPLHFMTLEKDDDGIAPKKKTVVSIMQEAVTKRDFKMSCDIPNNSTTFINSCSHFYPKCNLNGSTILDQLKSYFAIFKMYE